MQDIRYAFASLLITPHSHLAVLALALGIGATSAIFSVSMLSCCAPCLQEPRQLMTVWEQSLQRNGRRCRFHTLTIKNWVEQISL